ncbi:DUF3291 domain-containing protein [Hymenobacter terrenus]|uniref:DUF3291 domain-containing protein n=1 Tax=Hymenobacter terrenus TaxID=1629124 RepID=UPI0006195C75|nr:DUF3291 domain-containing protein [Hymenobacter terrenus]
MLPHPAAPGHFAELNIARMLVSSIEDPVMASFVAQLDAINALAERSPGFVWRLKDDAGNATSMQPYDDERIIVNLSVWESVETMLAFAYQSAHATVLRNRQQWFERLEQPAVVIWPVAPGHQPTLAEAKARLAFLQAHGASDYAFDFKYRRPPARPQTGNGTAEAI